MKALTIVKPPSSYHVHAPMSCFCSSYHRFPMIDFIHQTNTNHIGSEDLIRVVVLQSTAWQACWLRHVPQGKFSAFYLLKSQAKISVSGLLIPWHMTWHWGIHICIWSELNCSRVLATQCQGRGFSYSFSNFRTAESLLNYIWHVDKCADQFPSGVRHSVFILSCLHLFQLCMVLSLITMYGSKYNFCPSFSLITHISRHFHRQTADDTSLISMWIDQMEPIRTQTFFIMRQI